MTIRVELRANRGTIIYLSRILLTTKSGSGSVWQRSLMEFTLSVLVEGFGMTNP